MKTMVDPPRLLDGATDDLLRAALEAARGELPSPSEEARVMERFPFPDGGPPLNTPPKGEGNGVGPGNGTGAPFGPGAGAGAGAGSAGASGGGVAASLGAMGAKIAPALVATILLGAGLWYAQSRPDNVVDPPEARTITARTLFSGAPVDLGAPEPAPELRAPDSAVASSSAPSPTVAPPPSASAAGDAAQEPTEVELLRQAQAAVGSRPARALELVREHERRFSAGLLGQEREVIRIQALLAMGRRTDAMALADTFRARHPRSAYLPRLSDMLGLAPGPTERSDPAEPALKSTEGQGQGPARRSLDEQAPPLPSHDGREP